MAKSKNGGTRSMIRGRVGSDVYSVGKDGKGQRQQVVRSLAEEVANPRTESQMFGRMVMSSVMQAVSGLKVIIDHSFDGFPKGQPSISEFIRRNYALIKADAIANHASGNEFGLNEYQEKGMKLGKYVISAGSAVYPAALTPADGGVSFKVAVGATLTYGALAEAWGLTPDEYVTLISFKESPTFATNGAVELIYARLSIKDNLAPATVLTESNFLDAFNVEGNDNLEVSVSDGVFSVNFEDNDDSFYGKASSIVTRKQNGAYTHSTCQLNLGTGGKFAADVALPTYPVGTEMYLNGGNL